MNTETLVNFRLNIQTPLANEIAANFRLPSWPPPHDFPVVIDRDGIVVCRYKDAVWDLSAWDRVPKVVNFGDGVLRKGAAKISSGNAETFRIIAAWWLWGNSSAITASTFVSQHQLLRNLFALCTREGIDARMLSRYPAVVEKLANELPPARGEFALSLLHILYEQRDLLGFMLLDLDALRCLAKRLPAPPDKAQTPYVPPRIWTYQIRRLREMLDEFCLNADQIRACYQKTLDAYARDYGSLTAAKNKSGIYRRSCGSRGAFGQIAKECGIDQLLFRWYSFKKKGGKNLPIYAFSNYLTAVSRAGLAYVLNFSLMRVQEAWSLPLDCLRFEDDERLGEVAMLCGETTKTVHDDDARWVTSPSVEVAVRALQIIASLRQKLREACGERPQDSRPRLIQTVCEPWTHRSVNGERVEKVNYPSYTDLLDCCPKLFDPSELRVTQEDWNLAKLITPTLDEERFGVGKMWNFSWHQLRRTGAVNMQASGLVSNFSIQYQLKHSILSSSLYYGQGYSRLPINREARAEYIRTMYELMGMELAQLFSDRFVSPYGAARKQIILQLVTQSDDKKLLAASKAGRVAWRKTLLGGCTKTGSCEYGGIDNIVRCGGGDNKGPCADALFDRERLQRIQRLLQTIDERLEHAEVGSPYQQSLEAQRRSLENALNVLRTQ